MACDPQMPLPASSQAQRRATQKVPQQSLHNPVLPSTANKVSDSSRRILTGRALCLLRFTRDLHISGVAGRPAFLRVLGPNCRSLLHLRLRLPLLFAFGHPSSPWTFSPRVIRTLQPSTVRYGVPILQRCPRFPSFPRPIPDPQMFAVIDIICSASSFLRGRRWTAYKPLPRSSARYFPPFTMFDLSHPDSDIYLSSFLFSRASTRTRNCNHLEHPGFGQAHSSSDRLPQALRGGYPRISAAATS